MGKRVWPLLLESKSFTRERPKCGLILDFKSDLDSELVFIKAWAQLKDSTSDAMIVKTFSPGGGLFIVLQLC